MNIQVLLFLHFYFNLYCNHQPIFWYVCSQNKGPQTKFWLNNYWWLQKIKITQITYNLLFLLLDIKIAEIKSWLLQNSIYSFDIFPLAGRRRSKEPAKSRAENIFAPKDFWSSNISQGRFHTRLAGLNEISARKMANKWLCNFSPGSGGGSSARCAPQRRQKRKNQSRASDGGGGGALGRRNTNTINYLAD